MKSLLTTAFIFAMVGTSVEWSWVTTASEPVRLAIWGMTLLAFSNGLRRRLGVSPEG